MQRSCPKILTNSKRGSMKNHALNARVSEKLLARNASFHLAIMEVRGILEEMV